MLPPSVLAMGGGGVFHRLVEAADILRRGGMGVVPTDTCYTFACDILSRKGLERVSREGTTDRGLCDGVHLPSLGPEPGSRQRDRRLCPRKIKQPVESQWKSHALVPWSQDLSQADGGKGAGVGQ